MHGVPSDMGNTDSTSYMWTVSGGMETKFQSIHIPRLSTYSEEDTPIPGLGETSGASIPP